MNAVTNFPFLHRVRHLEVFDFPGVTLLYVQYLLKYIYRHNTRALTHKTHTFSPFPLVLPSSHFSLSTSKAFFITVFIFISAWPLSLGHIHLSFNNLFKFSVSHYQVLPFLFAPSQFRSLLFVHFSASASISTCFKHLIPCPILIAFPLSNRHISSFLWPVTCLRLYFRLISLNFFNSSTWIYNCYIGYGPMYHLTHFQPGKHSLVETAFLNLGTDNMTLNKILLSYKILKHHSTTVSVFMHTYSVNSPIICY